MNYIVGGMFGLVAVVVAVLGNRQVGDARKGGIVLRLFSWRSGQAAFLKLPIALVLAGVGVWFVLRGPP